MSNTRKARQLNSSSGLSQRLKFTWSGQVGNRNTMKRRQKAAEEAGKPKFILQPKGD